MIKKISIICVFLTLITSCKVIKVPYFVYTNALIQEKSPYLLQHAHNPVNWSAWNDAIVEKAKSEQKLLVISIGYAACHWCHVMEKESFSDTTVANLMNKNFINIKIDREERPDIDNIYMTACQLTNENGCGWPLNVIALPDGKPVWVGSYLPKKEWQETLEYFLTAQKNDIEKLKSYANHLKESIGGSASLSNRTYDKEGSFQKKDLDSLVEKTLENIDFENGGLLETPKFPTPGLFDFLLNYQHSTPNKKVQDAVLITLDKMAKGGIYDQIEGGFSRYSTDELWKVPHFEKMLYDNAQLISLYSHAFQVSKKPIYEKIVRQTILYLENNFFAARAKSRAAKKGGFYSSIDADSENEEGKFYTWTKNEIDEVLKEKSRLFCEYFSVKEQGNWQNNQNILHQNILHQNNQSIETLKKKYNLSENELETQLDFCKNVLLKERKKRVLPNLDTKILTSWNALMVKAYIDASKAFRDKNYLNSAQNLAEFIIKQHLDKNGQLRRVSYQNSSGFLDDYAYTIEAFTQLYQATFDKKWLFFAEKLSNFVFLNFKQEPSRLFHLTKNNALFVESPIEISDGVLPSSNAVFANVLFDLGILLQNPNFTETSKKMAFVMVEKAKKEENLSTYFYWGNLFLKQTNPPFEVAIIGAKANEKRNEILENYLPNSIILGDTKNESLPLLKGKLRKSETIIYVCQNNVCKMPTSEVKDALELMK